jgi:hypothetical protein
MNHSISSYKSQFTGRFFLTCLIILSSVSLQAQNAATQLVSIDLEKIVNNIMEVPLSTILEKVEYLPLKVSPESNLGNRIRLLLTDNYIIVYNSYPQAERKLLVFDRKTGAYLHQIGKLGNGPEEYQAPLEIFYNSFNNKIYAKGNKSIHIYNQDGKLLESFIPPSVKEFSGENSEIRLGIDAFLNADTFVNFTWNKGDVIRDQIVVFNKSGEIKYFPSRVTWPAKYSTGDYVHFPKPPVFYTWDSKLYVKATINDTVFNITADKLYPRIVLNSGSHRWPANLSSSDGGKLPFFFYVYSIYESTNHFFFEYRFQYDQSLKLPFMHLGIYDKKTKEVIYCKSNNTPLPSFVDDINGFLPVSPVIVNDKNEMVAFLEAMDIVTWKNQNPSKAKELQTKFPWLKAISEFDNPVIVIGKCKE